MFARFVIEGRINAKRFRAPLRGIEFVRIHSERVFRIQLHFGHRSNFEASKGGSCGSGCAEFLEMFAGVGESVVMGVRRTVAPRQRVSFCGGQWKESRRDEREWPSDSSLGKRALKAPKGAEENFPR